tara:strand:- start:4388 stop:4765 length:378 start_codon:yes stop_codon:yes gene_type:complete
MKKILTLLAVLVLSLTTYAQSGIGIFLCENTQEKPNVTTLTITQLTTCSELTVSNKNYSLGSYSATMAVGGDVRVLTVIGNKISEKLKSSIKKYKPNKIYFEQIVLIDEKGNKIYGATHTVILKK